jgi:hypothetical protein
MDYFLVKGEIKMKATLLDRIFGNCEKGIHKYQEYEIKSYIPAGFSIKEAYGDILETVKTRISVIRCKHCGKKLEE